MNYPLLTICLLTYNCEDTLEKTLRSILNQTYPNFEVLVSDNGSSDRTEEIIKSFQNPKLFFRKNIPNIKPGKLYDGCYDNCNGCLQSGLIKGEFVAFYHSDDIYDKEIAEKEATFLMKNPQAGAVFALGEIINQRDEIINKFKLPKELKTKDVYNFMEIFKALLNNGNIFMPTSSFMARKNIFKQVGLFTEEFFGTSRDLDMWLRILKKYPIGIVEGKLVRWRVDSSLKEKKPQSSSTKRADFFELMDYYLKDKLFVSKIDKKSLRQYEYQKRFDDTLIAMNLLIKGADPKEILRRKLTMQLFIAFIENITIRKIKAGLIRTALNIGITLGLSKPLGKILYKLRYSGN